MRGLRIAIVGSGGREHALSWVIGKSPFVERIYVTPGNGGIVPENRWDVHESNLAELVSLALEERIDLVVVGPEAPLCAGLVDKLEAAGIAAFGPSAAAAQLEGSKIFMKELCSEHGIPTARWDWTGVPGRPNSIETVAKMISSFSSPPVVKADGLCGGKGVVVAKSMQEAIDAAYAMLVQKKLGDTGSCIVIEDRLYGKECSMMFLCQDETALPLPPARDYKRALDGDEGDNTGGMGAYSPVLDVDDALVEQVRQTIILPALRAMAARGTPFRGLLYAGLMLTENGPMLLEFNVRFGDPETQVVLPRLESDIVPYLLTIARNESGGLARLGPLMVDSSVAVCFTLASEGYPGEYKTGYPISGWTQPTPQTLVFHAGTRHDNGRLVTSGGRVMSVVGIGPSVESARLRAVERADGTDFKNKYRRTDIALNV